MSGKFALVAASLLTAAACSAEPAPPAARSAGPQFPAALRGCWEQREPPSEEVPDGLSDTLVVHADRLILEGKGAPRLVGTIEKLERVDPKGIEALVSARDDGAPVTLATHAGPEAWVVLEGEQCLETTEGTIGVQAGESMMVRGGIPMALYGTGKGIRRALVLIIHPTGQSLGTTYNGWQPTGSCLRPTGEAP